MSQANYEYKKLKPSPVRRKPGEALEEAGTCQGQNAGCHCSLAPPAPGREHPDWANLPAGKPKVKPPGFYVLNRLEAREAPFLWGARLPFGRDRPAF